MAWVSSKASSCGSDGNGRSSSTSPQSSEKSGSDVGSNSPPPFRQKFNDNLSRNEGQPTIPPFQRPNHNFNNHNNGNHNSNNGYGRRNSFNDHGVRGNFDNNSLNHSLNHSKNDRDLSFGGGNGVGHGIGHGGVGHGIGHGGVGGFGRGNSHLDGFRGNAATWNHTELVQSLLQNNDVLITWMKEMNLLVKSWSCPKCTSSMVWEPIPLGDTKTVDRYHWRCPRRSCALTIHLRSSSFFDRPFYVTLASFIEIIYWWAKGAPMAFVVEETGCGMEFLGYAFCLLREVCGLMVNDFVVGGPGAVTGYTEALKLTINGMVCETYLGTMQESEKKWRRKFGSSAFLNILEHIAVVYDLGGLRDSRPNFNTGVDWRMDGQKSDHRSDHRNDYRSDQRPLHDSFRADKGKGLYGGENGVSSWQTETPSLWESSHCQPNLQHSFHEDRDVKSRHS